MRGINPAFIPRNHRIEQAIAAAVEREDFAPFEEMLQVLSRPYEDQPRFAALRGRAAARREGAADVLRHMKESTYRTTPLWQDAAAAPDIAAASRCPRSVDVLIVGAGYTGLSAARETAAAGAAHAGARRRRGGRRMFRPQWRTGRLQLQAVACGS